MAISLRTKLGVVLAVGVFAGLSSALLSLLLLAVAVFLIAWGQDPQRTETFFAGLPYAAQSSKVFARLSALLPQ